MASWMLSDGTTPNEPGFDIVPSDAADKVAAKREANEVDTMWTLLGLDALSQKVHTRLFTSHSRLL